ncbi:MAG: orotidine-5'-phosphate decarboxylase, partial [Lachnospiraceae bacterium]|nr:orotidine-5'-phosphate decarboxylase [Lachnospiraceae bacterium]
YCREKGLVVIGDVKRGDIGSTSAAYEEAHLGKVQVGSSLCAGFDEDFVTVNPYLGSDGVQPFIDVCREEKRGIFILVKTSNPSSGEFQDRLLRTGVTAGTAGEGAGDISFSDKPLYEVVGEKVAEWSEQLMGENGYSYIGAVVGATYPEQGSVLRRVMPKSFILVPGYGAQGGTGKDLIHFFDENRLGAIVNSSRGIIAAYQSERYGKFGPEGFADASRQAVIDMITDIDQAFASVGR